jgi:addiction module HigA family antidote
MMKGNKRSGPGWNIHPGEILREEFLKPMGLSVYGLAKEIHVPAPRVNDVVLEKRGITADTAVRLARFFGTSEQFWMNLQASYDVRKAKAELAQELAKIKPRERDRSLQSTTELRENPDFAAECLRAALEDEEVSLPICR